MHAMDFPSSLLIRLRVAFLQIGSLWLVGELKSYFKEEGTWDKGIPCPWPYLT